MGEIQQKRLQPVQHNIPLGRVEQQYQSLPFLRSITPDKIRITPGAAIHLSNIFVKRLFDEDYDVSNQGAGLEQRILNALRMAIPRGIVVSSAPSDDPHNPRDLQLEIYTYIDLRSVNPAFVGTAKLKVFCRLSVLTGTLAIRTIQRNFKIDKPAPEPEEIEEQIDYPDEREDYPDYPDTDY